MWLGTHAQYKAIYISINYHVLQFVSYCYFLLRLREAGGTNFLVPPFRYLGSGEGCR